MTSLSDAAVSALLWVSMTTLTRTVGDEKRRFCDDRGVSASKMSKSDVEQCSVDTI